MSFSFSFNTDDISDDIAETENVMPQPIDNEVIPTSGAKPKLHTLGDLLKALPSKISYFTIQVPGYDGIPIDIPRRELFDIRAQLMAEDQSPDQSIVTGLSTEDITPNIYEGGFKTWECSIDLANYLLTSLRRQHSAHEAEHHFIEVGAGTALPSLVLFHYFLTHSTSEWRAIHLSFADFNQLVLETTTVPNLLLTWHFARSVLAPPREGDLEISEDLLSRFLKDLSGKVIYLSGISGPWGGPFCELVTPFDDPKRRHGINTVMLASETIYSPSSIRAFTGVIMKSLRNAEHTGGKAKALVAAKRIYFGVGGGVDEFLDVLRGIGGKASTVWESEGPGIGRVILEVVIGG